MPVLFAFLAAVVIILILLKQLANAGIDLGGLNPFLWQRRRRWRQKYERDPLYALDDPMEVAAVLVVATAKSDGDMSAEQKRAMRAMFEEEFQLSEQAATDLIAASVHVLGQRTGVADEIDDILMTCSDRFTPAQAESTVELMERLAAIEGEPTPAQRTLIDGALGAFRRILPAHGKWH